MKAKVVSAFIDKHTGKLYREGDAVDFKEARVKELEKGGFVKADKAAAEKSAKEKE